MIQPYELNFNTTRALFNKEPTVENRAAALVQKVAYVVASAFVAIAETFVNAGKAVANAAIYLVNRVEDFRAVKQHNETIEKKGQFKEAIAKSRFNNLLAEIETRSRKVDYSKAFAHLEARERQNFARDTMPQAIPQASENMRYMPQARVQMHKKLTLAELAQRFAPAAPSYFQQALHYATCGVLGRAS
jgi:hypothetical protein